MTAETIAIADIDASERLRPLDPDTVAGYAAIAEQRLSEGKSPLIQPMIVRPVSDGYKLVAGGHRLAALIEINRETLVVGVDVVVKPIDEQEAIEDEVFENLANAGLNALDRMIFLAEAKEIADAKRGETRGRKSKINKLQEDKNVPESGIISSPRFTKAAAMRMHIVITAFEMFSIEAKALEDEKQLLESRLLAADCRIEALTIPDFLSNHLRDAAIREGARAGVVIDLRGVFADEQEFNRAQNDGDAA
jgi:hypothetical protein